tara:strand:+ start:51 stop:911 length:861 start_codon:yes stop_codon:yes gene_type:complete
MIDLKRNSKKELVKANGLRKQSSSTYSPNQKKDFKISRGKFFNFLLCKRCFYLDRIKGLESPGVPGWSLNETTDLLLKKEFDYCRERQVPHRLFISNKLDNLVPFYHEEIDNWRDSLHKGLVHRYKNTNIILTGGIDDIWQNKISKKLIIVDYKSQAKLGRVDKINYLEDPYHDGYKIQMDFYAYLLLGMGFKLDSMSYFLVCNAKRDDDRFDKTLNFDEYLIPYRWNIDWIEKKLEEMIHIMNSFDVPPSNLSCKNCAYSEQYAKTIYKEINSDNNDIQGTLFNF